MFIWLFNLDIIRFAVNRISCFLLLFFIFGMNLKISCIVPIYNEGKRVSNVLDALIEHEKISEIIIVNDGSSDDSEKIVKEKIVGIGDERVKFISYKKNCGKTHAVKMGLKKAKNPWIMTIDSDLVGLTKKNITDLIMPIEKGLADVSMSLRKNSLGTFKFLGMDFVSGERVFRKNLIGDLERLEKLPGFGLETFMNGEIVKRELRIVVVDFKNVITPRKSAKFGFWAGIKGDTKMVFQIISLLGVFGVVKQFRKMLKLKI